MVSRVSLRNFKNFSVKTTLVVFTLILFIATFSLNTNFSFNKALAQTDLPQHFTLDGRLFIPGSTTDPLLDNDTLITIQVLNPDRDCVLYEEEQPVNTLGTNGYFSIRVGSNIGNTKRSGRDEGNSMNTVFYNTTAVINGRTQSNSNCTYDPASGDERFFRFFIKPSSASVAVQLSDDMPVNSVPQAIVAQTLQGYSPANFFRTSATSTQLKLDNLLTTEYSNITGLLDGSNPTYVRNDPAGTVFQSRSSDPSSPTTGQVWFNASDNKFKYYDGTTVHDVTNGSGSAVSITAGEGLDGGTITGTGTIDISDSGVTTDKLADGSVSTAKLIDTSVTEVKLADSAVTSVKLADDSVTTAKVVNEGITTGKLADSAVTTVKINNGAVTDAKLATGIDAAKITVNTLPASVVPTGTDDTKLPLTGGTLTGKLTLGDETDYAGFDLINTGHITMNGQKTITIGRYNDTQQTSLIGTLTPVNAGALWFNTTTGKLMYWSGTQEYELSETTGAGGDITAVNTNTGSGLSGGDTSGPVTLSINVDGTTIEIATNTLRVADGGIGTAKLADSSVTEVKLADGAVTSTKLADDAVTTAKVVNEGITSAKLQDGAVTSVKISDGAVTTNKVGDSAITNIKLADGSVGTTKIADTAVTDAKLANSAVTTAKINDGAVTTIKLADGSVTTVKLADDAVSTVKVQDSAITSDKIANSAIIAAKLANDAVTSGKILDATIIDADIATTAAIAWSKIDKTGASAADLGAIPDSRLINTNAGSGLSGGGDLSADRSLAVNVDGATINVNGSNALQVMDGGIGTVKIADGAVTTAKVVNAGITTAKIADSAVTTLKLNDGSVTTVKLANDAVTSAKILDGTITSADIDRINVSKIASGATEYFSYMPAGTECTPGQILKWDATNDRWLCDNDSNTSDHGLLSGLTDDDHTQYVMLAGRAGGQNLRGGTAASNSLTLESTSHATKGHVIMQPNGGSVGIGTTEPVSRFHISGGPDQDDFGMYDSATPYFRVQRFSIGNTTVTSLLGGSNFGTMVTGREAGHFAIALPANDNQDSFSVIGPSNYAASQTFDKSLFTVKASGNVGIGSTQPQSLLDVAGRIRAQEICDEAGSNCKDISSGWGAGGDIDGIVTNAGSGLAGGAASGTATLSVVTDNTTIEVNGANALRIKDGGVGTAKLADGAVTAIKLASDAVTSAKILDGTIMNSDINAAASIDWTKINKSGAVASDVGAVPTSRTIATNAGSAMSGGGDLTMNRDLSVNVDNTTIEINSNALRLRDGGVGTAKIADGAVTSVKLAADAVTSAKILDGTITSADVSSISIGKISNALTEYFRYMPAGIACNGNQTLKWDSGNTRWICGDDLGAIDHGLLTGLADDDHTQYVMLAGRAGGQNLRGGTAASNNLTLESTSHATKGHVLIQPNGGNVGIGTTSSAAKLTVNGGATFDVSAGGVNGQVLIASHSGVAGQGGLMFSQNTNYAATSEGFKLYTTGTGSIGSGRFYLGKVVNNAPDTITELLTVQSNGNIGIGSTSPQSLLDVAGRIRAQELCDETGSNCKDISTGWSTGVATTRAINTVTGSGLTGGGDLSADRSLAVSVDNTTVEIATNTIRLKDGGVSTAKLANTAVTEAKLANSAVTSAKIADGTIVSADVNNISIGKISNAVTEYFSYMPAGTECTPGQVLKWDSTNDRWLCDNDSNTSDHGLLSGLTDDDHTQYVMLAGRTGGQNLRGGTAASNNLTLESTSHATKGHVILQPTGGNVGIGTSVPTALLHIASPLATTSTTLLSLRHGNSSGGDIGATTSANIDFTLVDNNTTAPENPQARIAVRSGYAESSLHGEASGQLLFYTAIGDTVGDTANTNTLLERMRITEVGNVGIGSANPQSLLDVAGRIRAQEICDETGSNCKDISTGWSSAVSSVFGRTGAVVAAGGDYTGTQVTNVPAGNIAATNTQAAINELDTEKVAKAGDTMTGHLSMGNQREVRFVESGSTNYIALRAPAALAADFTLTLPIDDGTPGQVLTTDGAGVLSWTGVTTGTVTSVATGSGLTGGPITGTGTISVATGGITSTHISDGTIAAADIGTDAVTTVKIQNSAVTDAKIASVAVNKITSAGSQYFTYAPNGAACGTGAVLKKTANGWECGTDNDAGGDITQVTTAAASGLTGGGTSGALALAVDSGTSATGVVQNQDIPNCTASQKLQMSAGPVYTWSCATDTIAVTDHGALTGNGDDDHTQYVMLAGRSGGQNLRGGTAASNSLTLESTSHATKGYVLLQPNGGNVGINVANPAEALDINGAINIRGATSTVLKLGGETSISGPGLSDGAVVRYDGDLFGAAADGLLFEKTDFNANQPDGGILFANRGLDGVRVPALAIRGTGSVGVGTTTPTAKLDVNGKIRGTATFSHDTSSTTLSASNVSPSVFAPDISTTIAVQSGDVIKVDLACNLTNNGGTTYMRSEVSSSPGGAWLQTPNWITVSDSASNWGGGFSTGLYRANADGNVTFQAYWHVSAGTGYAVYCNINTFVIGKQ